jgi:osmoprotectant transport system permease protein
VLVRRLALAALVLVLVAALLGAASAKRGGVVVVASKSFAESRLLAELYAQAIESATPLRVERRLGLAGSDVCFAALRSGAVDLYPEYTGTGLVSLLHAPPSPDAAGVLRTVRQEFRGRWNLVWLSPHGFDNTWAIAVPERVARAHRLATISDLAREAPRLRAAFTQEFLGRDDGLVGLRRAYGSLAFSAVRGMGQALRYTAAESGDADVIDVYATDGRIAASRLVVLADDRHFFPPYQAAPLVRGTTLSRRPEIAMALAPLGGVLDDARMRVLNAEVEVRHRAVEDVARDLLADLGLAHRGSRVAATTRRPSLASDLWTRRAAIGARTAEHLGLAGLAVLLAAAAGVPLGIWLVGRPRASRGVLAASGLVQAIPSMALLAFLIPVFGVGFVPASIALVLYGLLPIVQNAHVGVRDAAPDAARAAHALGMTRGQVLWRVQLPLAAPTVVAGIRTSAVVGIGTATLASLVGAGGLGDPILSGLALNDVRLVLSGAIPAAILALGVDGAFALAERLVRAKGI